MNARPALVRAVAPALAPVLATALALLVLAGCAAGREEGAVAAPAPASASPSVTPGGSPSATTPTAAPAATASPAAPVPSPAVRTVAVSYVGGEVTGTSGREEVPLGEPVVLRISSDVVEEVHVHGYDVYGDLPAGGSVDIPLTADIPGVFEVELHDSGKVLFQLRVA